MKPWTLLDEGYFPDEGLKCEILFTVKNTVLSDNYRHLYQTFGEACAFESVYSMNNMSHSLDAGPESEI